MKKLIVNADDFGLDDETVACTIEGFERGKITSATLMAGQAATSRAVAFAKQHPEFSFGVHLCLVDEAPISDPREIPSLVDPATGRLWTTRNFIFRNFLGLVRVEELVAEMTAQIAALETEGLCVSHFDGHGHNHRLPQAIRALEIVQKSRPQMAVRRCQDLFVGRPGLLSRLINRPMQRRLDGAGFRRTDHFLMAAGHTTDERWFSKALTVLPEGITEIGIHPGRAEAWRRLDTADCFRTAAADYGVELMTYKELGGWN